MRIIVSSHAAVRYLERFRGVDLDPVRRSLERRGIECHDVTVLQEVGTSAERLAPLIATPQAIRLITAWATRVRIGDMVLFIDAVPGATS